MAAAFLLNELIRLTLRISKPVGSCGCLDDVLWLAPSGPAGQQSLLSESAKGRQQATQQVYVLACSAQWRYKFILC
jgi:hypothetical protein